MAFAQGVPVSDLLHSKPSSKPPRHRCQICGQQKRNASSMYRVWVREGVNPAAIGLTCGSLCAKKLLKRHFAMHPMDEALPAAMQQVPK